MEKEEFNRIAVLFEEIFDLMECAISKAKNLPSAKNDTAEAICMLDKIKQELKI